MASKLYETLVRLCCGRIRTEAVKNVHYQEEPLVDVQGSLQQDEVKDTVPEGAAVCVDDVTSLSASVPSDSPALQSKLKVPFTDLTFHALIGKGSFKQVYRGKWNNTNVAIVAMRRGGLVTEARLMQQLGAHPNLVQFYRWSTDCRGNEYVVVELVPFGSLDKVLAQFGQSLRNRSKLMMCEQICHAMCEMASAGVLHRDLAARNILVQSMQPVHVKVSDFGLARVSPHHEAACGLGKGACDEEPAQQQRQQQRLLHVGSAAASTGSLVPVRWSAPEVLRTGAGWSEKSDVYSYGVTMWEIFSNGAEPYANRSDVEAAEAIVGGERLPRPKDCPHQVYALMRDCWHQDPARRPSFQNIAGVFKRWRDMTLAAKAASGRRGSTGDSAAAAATAAAEEAAALKALEEGDGGGGRFFSSGTGPTPAPSCASRAPLDPQLHGVQPSVSFAEPPLRRSEEASAGGYGGPGAGTGTSGRGGGGGGGGYLAISSLWNPGSSVLNAAHQEAGAVVAAAAAATCSPPAARPPSPPRRVIPSGEVLQLPGQHSHRQMCTQAGHHHHHARTCTSAALAAASTMSSFTAATTTTTTAAATAVLPTAAVGSLPQGKPIPASSPPGPPRPPPQQQQQSEPVATALIPGGAQSVVQPYGVASSASSFSGCSGPPICPSPLIRSCGVAASHDDSLRDGGPNSHRRNHQSQYPKHSYLQQQQQQHEHSKSNSSVLQGDPMSVDLGTAAAAVAAVPQAVMDLDAVATAAEKDPGAAAGPAASAAAAAAVGPNSLSTGKQLATAGSLSNLNDDDSAENGGPPPPPAPLSFGAAAGKGRDGGPLSDWPAGGVAPHATPSSDGDVGAFRDMALLQCTHSLSYHPLVPPRPYGLSSPPFGQDGGRTCSAGGATAIPAACLPDSKECEVAGAGALPYLNRHNHHHQKQPPLHLTPPPPPPPPPLQQQQQRRFRGLGSSPERVLRRRLALGSGLGWSCSSPLRPTHSRGHDVLMQAVARDARGYRTSTSDTLVAAAEHMGDGGDSDSSSSRRSSSSDGGGSSSSSSRADDGCTGGRTAAAAAAAASCTCVAKAATEVVDSPGPVRRQAGNHVRSCAAIKDGGQERVLNSVDLTTCLEPVGTPFGSEVEGGRASGRCTTTAAAAAAAAAAVAAAAAAAAMAAAKGSRQARNAVSTSAARPARSIRHAVRAITGSCVSARIGSSVSGGGPCTCCSGEVAAAAAAAASALAFPWASQGGSGFYGLCETCMLSMEVETAIEPLLSQGSTGLSSVNTHREIGAPREGGGVGGGSTQLASPSTHTRVSAMAAAAAAAGQRRSSALGRRQGSDVSDRFLE